MLSIAYTILQNTCKQSSVKLTFLETKKNLNERNEDMDGEGGQREARRGAREMS